MRAKSLTLALFAAVAAGLASGCTMQPGEPLIAMKERPATVLPGDVAEVRPDDGFPVILADPVTVAGLPRTAESVAADTAELERRRVASSGRAARVASGPSHAAELERLRRNHVEETRRKIEAGARPQTADATPAAAAPLAPPPAAAAPPPAAEARPAADAEPARPVGPAAPYVNEGAVAPQ